MSDLNPAGTTRSVPTSAVPVPVPTSLPVPSASPAIQGWQIAWTNLLGGSGDEVAYDVKETADHGFIVVGGTSSQSGSGDVSGKHGTSGGDFWVMKLAADGKLEWQKCYGGTGDDMALAVVVLNDGYVIGGSSKSTNNDVKDHIGGKDVWVIKISLSGELLKSKSFGTASNEDLYDLKPTSTGGFVFAGAKSNDGVSSSFWVAKFGVNPDGSFTDIQSEYTYGGNGYIDFAHSVEVVQEMGFERYVAAGYSRFMEGDVCDEDAIVVKLESTLSSATAVVKGFGAWNGEGIGQILTTAEGDFIGVGSTHSYKLKGTTTAAGCPTDPFPSKYASGDALDTTFHGSQHEMWALKLRSDLTKDTAFGLNLNGLQCYGGTGGEQGYTVVQKALGGYLIGGEAASTDGDILNKVGGSGNFDMNLIELDALGKMVSQKTFGGTADDGVNKIIRTSDGSGYIAVGYSGSIDLHFDATKDIDGSGNHGGSDIVVLKISIK